MLFNLIPRFLAQVIVTFAGIVQIYAHTSVQPTALYNERHRVSCVTQWYPM